MKNLIIVCAGSMGREVLQMVKDINKISPTWNVIGFLSDVPDTLSNQYKEKIIGSISEWEVTENQYFALAIADPAHKKMISEKLLAKGAKFVPIIHPSAIISDTAKIGEGSIIYWGTTLGPDCNIGRFCTIMSTIGHDSVVGDYTTICSNCSTNGHFTTGTQCYIGSNVACHPGITLGDNVKIGMGSIVLKSVKSGQFVFGNPAQQFEL